MLVAVFCLFLPKVVQESHDRPCKVRISFLRSLASFVRHQGCSRWCGSGLCFSHCSGSVPRLRRPVGITVPYGKPSRGQSDSRPCILLFQTTFSDSRSTAAPNFIRILSMSTTFLDFSLGIVSDQQVNLKRADVFTTLSFLSHRQSQSLQLFKYFFSFSAFSNFQYIAPICLIYTQVFHFLWIKCVFNSGFHMLVIL